MDGEPPDPLAVVFAAVEARAGAAPEGPLSGAHTRAALDAYARCTATAPAALLAMASDLAPRVLGDAAAARAAAREDPAAPGLGPRCDALLSELGDLAAAFSSLALGGEAPDPGDRYADEYRAVCAELDLLFGACQDARPVWGLLRQSRADFAATRARPPPRRGPPLAPLADDREYYL